MYYIVYLYLSRATELPADRTNHIYLGLVDQPTMSLERYHHMLYIVCYLLGLLGLGYHISQQSSMAGQTCAAGHAR